MSESAKTSKKKEKSQLVTTLNMSTIPPFATRLITWQKKMGRHDLPWQKTRDAYRVWLSEIMLQQTQVSAVINYYQRFLQRFPTVETLAAASIDDVMALWSGLGYYSRARNLHQCAKKIVDDFAGQFPADYLLLQTLPGIGRSTAAAISVFAYGAQAAILDGNVKRVLSRVFGISGWPGLRSVEQQLWQLATSLLPETEIESYTQGLMDFGATLCRRSKPLCLSEPQVCPFANDCVALNENRIHALPEPKPRKAIPLRHAVVLILRQEGRLLLQRRPPVGIWGGLWSFPQISVEGSISWPSPLQADWLHIAHDVGEIQGHTFLPEMMHTFTHFRLRLLPIVFDVQRLPCKKIADAVRMGQWFCARQRKKIGMPAPIKLLLENLLGCTSDGC